MKMRVPVLANVVQPDAVGTLALARSASAPAHANRHDAASQNGGAHSQRPDSNPQQTPERTFATIARGLLSTTRPSVVGLVFFTGLPALAIDDATWPSLARGAAIIAGIALCAAASSVFNAWLERESDKNMERTRSRPVPTGLVLPGEALAFAIALSLGGVALLGWQGVTYATQAERIGGMVAGAATIAFYVLVYTIWLKPRTPLNIVIGGAAGAAPPMIVDAALHGRIGLMSVTLFTIVFLWTPPHFWAISLFRKADYQNAGFPMLPITHGNEATYGRMVLYALAIVPFATLPALTRHLSVGYGLFAMVTSLWFLWSCVTLLRGKTDALAKKTFFASLLYLHAVFTAMIVDLMIHRPLA
jgi:heme o synthase